MTVSRDVAGDVSARSGQPVGDGWLQQVVGEMMAAIRTVAPCRELDWLTPDDLHEDAYRVLVAAMSRRLSNPLEARHQTIGEFSVTLDVGTAGGFTDLELQTLRRVSGCGGKTVGPSYTIRTVPTAPLRLDASDRFPR